MTSNEGLAPDTTSDGSGERERDTFCNRRILPYLVLKEQSQSVFVLFSNVLSSAVG